MIVDHVSSPQAQRITRDVATQTVANQRSTLGYDLLNCFGRCTKNVLTDNFLIQLKDPQTRAHLSNIDSPFENRLLLCCGATGTAACALTGCYFDHSCSVLTGQTILGCLFGNQIGRSYRAFLQSEIKNQYGLLNTNAETRTSARAVTITRQPESAPNTTVEGPPSYQSLLESGAIVNGQARYRGTHASS